MRVLLSSIALCGTLLTAPAGAVIYTITDLGTLPGGTGSQAGSLNDLGQVAGDSNVPPNAFLSVHAILYSNGTMTDLGTLGGGYSQAFGINNTGQVVGVSDSEGPAPGFPGPRRAFLYSNGTMTSLGTLGGSSSYAMDINDAGQIVGQADTVNRFHAFLYDNGVMIDLGTLGIYDGWSEAFGVNNAGQVVGESTAGDGFHAFLYSNGAMTDLGTLGGLTSRAVDINETGQVVGRSMTATGATHAFLYSNGIMTDLGTLGGDSGASAINDNGQVVGYFDFYRAFLYADGVMTDLNSQIASDSGWILHGASDINDVGQIVGSGEIGGETHAFLLTPADCVDVAIDCTSEFQVCDPPFSTSFSLDAPTPVTLRYTVGERHCSSVKLHVLLDGTPMLTTDWLGWPGATGAFASLPLSVPLELGTLEVGEHTVTLQAEGQQSGCNEGRLGTWGGA